MLCWIGKKGEKENRKKKKTFKVEKAVAASCNR